MWNQSKIKHFKAVLRDLKTCRGCYQPKYQHFTDVSQGKHETHVSCASDWRSIIQRLYMQQFHRCNSRRTRPRKTTTIIFSPSVLPQFFPPRTDNNASSPTSHSAWPQNQLIWQLQGGVALGNSFFSQLFHELSSWLVMPRERVTCFNCCFISAAERRRAVLSEIREK